MTKTILTRWVPVGAWMALIFVVSSQPELPGPPNPLLSTFGHFFEYGVLALLLLRAVYQSGRVDVGSAVLWAIAIVALYAASDELHQAFVPGRTADIGDIAWDLSGAGVAILAWIWLSRLR
ncbi:MAG: VanZ family protein [Chloroflexi bacterium]|nr:VanZ family protein [Chloroflexota bacterium]